MAAAVIFCRLPLKKLHFYEKSILDDALHELAISVMHNILGLEQ